MSITQFGHPFDIVRHPHFEPEVKRAILASWASDSAAVKDKPAFRQPPGVANPIHVDDIFMALRAVDEGGDHAQ